MNTIRGFMGVAIESDATRFSGDEFTHEHWGAVRGAVRRRRAVRSAGVGSVSVVGAGAIALGASAVPWSSFVFGAAPAGTPSLICTTTTPVAAGGFDSGVPAGATRVLVDESTSEGYFIGTVDGEARAWHADGTAVDLSVTAPNVWTLTFRSGETVDLETGPDANQFLIIPNTAFTVLAIDGLADKWSPALNGVAEDGTTLGRAVRSDDGTMYLAVGDTWTALTGTGAELYTFIDDTGNTVVVTIVENEPTASASGVGPAPTVTCVSSSPEPSPSASASPTPTVSATTSAIATPTGDSPFRCDFPIDADEFGTQDLKIGAVSTEPADEVNAIIDELVDNIGESYWNRAEGDEVLKVGLVTSETPSRDALSGAGGTSAADPMDLVAAVDFDDSASGAAFARGLGFVAVRDGVVVGTLPADLAGGGNVYNNGDDPDPASYFLTPDGAFEACPGVELGEDWDLYAVAGQTFVYSDGSVEVPIYAWKRISGE